MQSPHILWISSDVLEQHLIKELNLCELVACSFVCSRLRKLLLSRLSKMPRSELSQGSILQDIYQHGSMNLLTWFHVHLRYPSLSYLSGLPERIDEDDLRLNSNKDYFSFCINFAARGNFLFFIFILILIFFVRREHGSARGRTCSRRPV